MGGDDAAGKKIREESHTEREKGRGRKCLRGGTESRGDSRGGELQKNQGNKVGESLKGEIWT